MNRLCISSGNILVNSVRNMDIGHGMRGSLSSALPEASIFAAGHIGTITATRRGGVEPILSVFTPLVSSTRTLDTGAAPICVPGK